MIEDKTVWCWICCESGLFANEDCENIIFKKFVQDEEPKKFCELCQRKQNE